MTTRRQFGVSLLSCVLLLLLAHTAAADTLPELKARQTRIQALVPRAVACTVALTDGTGWGSGVIVSSDGYVLTAGHVLLAIDRDLEAVFPDGKIVKATALGKNLNVDAGMVKLEGAGPWPHVEMGDSSAVRPGDWCIATGHPGGFDLRRSPPVRMGRVQSRSSDEIISDAAIVVGDSGGPLFNLDGKLIGIHSSIGSSITENRHVPVNVFLQYWDRLRQGETWGTLPGMAEPKGPFLGVVINPEANNAVVVEVKANSAAYEAGIKAGDRIQSFDGKPVSNLAELKRLVDLKRVGDEVTVELERNGISLRVKAKLKSR